MVPLTWRPSRSCDVVFSRIGLNVWVDRRALAKPSIPAPNERSRRRLPAHSWKKVSRDSLTWV